MNYWLIFLTGLTSGGFTCLAIQGGLLATAISINKSPHRKFSGVILPTAIFLIAKISAYTFLGFLLGLFGSVFQLSLTTTVIMQFLVGILMVISALRMLDIHPIFRRFTLTPPKSIFKFMRQKAVSPDIFSPLILGLLTIFLPCATTQAMEVAAIGTQNPVSGALTMFAFTLGTAPFFFILGTLATRFEMTFQKYVYPIAAVFVLVLGILAIDNALTLSGSPLTLKGFWQTATSISSSSTQNSVLNNNTQTAQINVTATGYNPNKITLKANIPAQIKFITQNVHSCSRAIVFPTLKISRTLPVTGETLINLPALPKGTIPFSCSMGMYQGQINVE